MKKYWKFLLCGLIVGVLGIFIYGSRTWVMEKFDESEKELQNVLLKVLAVEKGMPDSARYFKTVRILEGAAKGKMNALEVIEVSKVITEICILNSDLGLTESIIFGLIERESGFNPKAKSHMKAYGLTQCIEGTFNLHLPFLGYSSFSESLAYNPVINVRVGLLELIRLRKAFLVEGVDSWHIVLAAYYYGERPIWNLLSKEKSSVSLEYGKGVMDLAKKWKEKGL